MLIEHSPNNPSYEPDQPDSQIASAYEEPYPGEPRDLGAGDREPWRRFETLLLLRSLVAYPGSDQQRLAERYSKATTKVDNPQQYRTEKERANRRQSLSFVALCSMIIAVD